MKPMSQEDVKRFALSHGAKLEIDGRSINSARLQVATKPQVKPPAYMPQRIEKPTAETIPATQDPLSTEAIQSIDNYAASNFLLGESNVKLMIMVKDMLQKVTDRQPDKRPTKWIFNVKRDAHGLMERIEAVAQFKDN